MTRKGFEIHTSQDHQNKSNWFRITWFKFLIQILQFRYIISVKVLVKPCYTDNILVHIELTFISCNSTITFKFFLQCLIHKPFSKIFTKWQTILSHLKSFFPFSKKLQELHSNIMVYTPSLFHLFQRNPSHASF